MNSSTSSVELEFENVVENGRIIRISMALNNPDKVGYHFIDMELIAENTYDIINYPTQKVTDKILNKLVEDVGVFRMGNVVLFTDESRSYIKLMYGATIRKESKYDRSSSRGELDSYTTVSPNATTYEDIRRQSSRRES